MSGAQQRRTSRRSILPALTGGGYLAILILIAGLIVVAGALAVHASGDFELEGNIVDDPAPGPDWGSIFDASGNAIPITYQGHDGKQYVVIAAGGGGHIGGNRPTSDSLIAFSLPDRWSAESLNTK